MNNSAEEILLREYQELFRLPFIEEDVSEIGKRKKGRPQIFTTSLTCMIMLIQSFRQASLSKVLKLFKEGGFRELLEDEQYSLASIATSNSGYCRARQRISIDALIGLNKLIVESGLNARIGGKQELIVNIDGSIFPLHNYPNLREEFGANENSERYGTAEVLVVSTHEIDSGLSLVQKIGSRNTGEQQLAEEIFKELPKNTLVVGDRNFGIFKMFKVAQEHGHRCLFRLTKQRYQSLCKRNKVVQDVETICWQASELELEKYSDLKVEDKIEGRIVRIKPNGFREEFYFFCTDPSLTIEDLWRLYGKRQNIETDFRHLKCDLRKSPIQVKSADMVRKEILITYCTYNMLKILIAKGAELVGVPFRRISFTGALSTINSVAARLFRLPGEISKEVQESTARFFYDCIKADILPNRTRRRVEPRKTISRKAKFPVMKKSRHQERDLINKNNE